MRSRLFATCFVITVCPIALSTGTIASTAPAASDAQIASHKLQQDVAIAELLDTLRVRALHGHVLFRDVRVVNPDTGTVTAGQAVLVSGRTIQWVGNDAAAPSPSDAQVVPGRGRYLIPGLVDMHVHTNNAGDLLLDLSAGVTTVRDMAGFPWMLKMRDAVNSGAMLAPTFYVAGPLLNQFALQGYAVTPIDAVDARRIVRQEAACGYDFIKVWNVLPEPMFDAIAEAAHAVGMDLVGHVPQGISVRHAAEAGMRTMEHLKGFVNDATLELGDTDYAAAVDGPPLWITPTLYANLAHVRPHGDEARTLLTEPRYRYVPLRKRLSWSRMADEPESRTDALMRKAQPILAEIMRKLEAEHSHFLAGTDSANFPFEVRGFALLEELALLHKAGLSPQEALRAATSEPARAMRDPHSFGLIESGMRADLVLLEANPLEDITAVTRNDGVMVHGSWLSRPDVDAALASLARLYAEPDEAVSIRPETSVALLAKVKALSKIGFVFAADEIEGAAQTSGGAGAAQRAASFRALAFIPSTWPCVDIRPN
jgi:imidazolonepropionase-like amidohydrolase